VTSAYDHRFDADLRRDVQRFCVEDLKLGQVEIALDDV